jgi:carbonic anhydrase/acetyltransferase-like protein (isoleucine patch superfamily)
MGMPGKIKRELTMEEQEMIPLSAKYYIENYKKYKELYKPIT